MSIELYQVVKIQDQIKGRQAENLDHTLTKLSQKNINIGDIIIGNSNIFEYAMIRDNFNVEIIKVLIKHMTVKDINKKYMNGQNPLLDACWDYMRTDKIKSVEYASIIRLLIESGADCDTRTNVSNTCLIRIARMTKSRFEMDQDSTIGIIKLLIDKGADRRVVNNDGDTAEILALKNDNDRIVNFLRDYKIDHELDREITDSKISKKINEKLRSFIDSDKSIELDDLLGQLKLRGVDLNAIRVSNYPILYLAANTGKINCVTVLIKYNVNVHEMYDDECALSQACYRYCGSGTPDSAFNYSQIIRLLIAHGADCKFQPSRQSLNTPLMRICNSKSFKSDIIDLDRLDLIKLFLDNGADRSTIRNGKTAEARARDNGYERIADFIRDYPNGKVVDKAESESSGQSIPAQIEPVAPAVSGPIEPVESVEPVAPVDPSSKIDKVDPSLAIESIPAESIAIPVQANPDMPSVQADQYETNKTMLEHDIIIAKLENELLDLNILKAEKAIMISRHELQKMDNDIEIEKKRAELVKLRAIAL